VKFPRTSQFFRKRVREGFGGLCNRPLLICRWHRWQWQIKDAWIGFFAALND
jgi:hypothetical protein